MNNLNEPCWYQVNQNDWAEGVLISIVGGTWVDGSQGAAMANYIVISKHGYLISANNVRIKRARFGTEDFRSFKKPENFN